MKRFYLLFILFFSGFVPKVAAAERTESELQQLSSVVLNQVSRRSMPASKMASLHQMPQRLADHDALVIYGYETGGMVFLSKDTDQEPVLGYSDAAYTDTIPEGLQWWLWAMNSSLRRTSKKRLSSVMTSTSVAPFLTSKWGQRAPYNNDLVFNIGGADYQFVTGCVATAMAQVMYYYKYPAVGHGFHKYDINYSNAGTAHFESQMSEHRYDWYKMKDTFNGKNDEGASAVAMLMKDCGIAVQMRYNGNASSSSSHDVATAMRNYFSFNCYTRGVERKPFSSNEWMRLIFAELDARRPVLYSGVDADAGGHAFLLDGYDEKGFVHVNWGWYGSYDGYYNIDLLNPDEDQYSESQYAVIGLQPEDEQLVTKTVTITEAGTLSTLLTDEEKMTVQRLILKGSMNGADVSVIRQMAGLTDSETMRAWNLVELDLSDAKIVGSNDTYGQYNDRTENDVFPEDLFLATYKQNGSNYVQHIGICNLVMPSTVTALRNSSIVACENLTTLRFPKSMQDIANYSFRFLGMGLKKVVSEALTPPTLDGDVFASLDCLDETILYVPEAAIETYKKTTNWNKFYDIRSIESDTIDKPNSQTDTIPSNPPENPDEEKPGCVLQEVDGLWYYLCLLDNGSRVAEVTYAGAEYSADHNYTELQTIVLPEQVRYNDNEYELFAIADSAFLNALHLETIDLPETVLSIGDASFGNTSLQRINAHAIEPPVFMGYDYSTGEYYNVVSADSVFYRKNWNEKRLLDVTVYVPNEAVDAYKQAYIWKELTIRSATNPTDAVENITDMMTLSEHQLLFSEPTECEIYTIDGRLLYQGKATTVELEEGLYIVKTQGKTLKIKN